MAGAVSRVLPMGCSSGLSGVIEVLGRPLPANIMALFVPWWFRKGLQGLDPAAASSAATAGSAPALPREPGGQQARGSFLFGDVRREQEKRPILLSSYTASWTLDPAVCRADTLLGMKETLFNSDFIR